MSASAPVELLELIGDGALNQHLPQRLDEVGRNAEVGRRAARVGDHLRLARLVTDGGAMRFDPRGGIHIAHAGGDQGDQLAIEGIDPGADFHPHCLTLGPGDSLVAYTDGLTDMRDEAGNRLGFERARYLAATRLQLSCPELVESVVRAARDETLTAPDDIMLVAARYLGMPASLDPPTEPEMSLPNREATAPAVTTAGKGAPWRPV